MNETDRNHLVTYVRTSKVTDWKRLAFLHSKNGAPAFVYRSDDKATFGKYAKEDAVLWVIESHPGAPPSLVARLEAIGQVHGKLRLDIVTKSGRTEIPDGMLLDFEYGWKRRWYAVGDPGRSRFFGYNDVSKALMKTDLEPAPAPWRGATVWDSSFGKTLQRPRRVKSGQENLATFAEDISERSIFLSWKHCDFEDRHHDVRALVDGLVSRDIECWWDQLALPPSRALDKLNEKPELLEMLLNYGLAKSSVLLALGSEAWGRPSSQDISRNWTLGEWQRARRRFVYEIDGPPACEWPSGRVKKFIRHKSLSEAVDEIAHYFDECRPVASAKA